MIFLLRKSYRGASARWSHPCASMVGTDASAAFAFLMQHAIATSRRYARQSDRPWRSREQRRVEWTGNNVIANAVLRIVSGRQTRTHPCVPTPLLSRLATARSPNSSTQPNLTHLYLASLASRVSPLAIRQVATFALFSSAYSIFIVYLTSSLYSVLLREYFIWNQKKDRRPSIENQNFCAEKKHQFNKFYLSTFLDTNAALNLLQYNKLNLLNELLMLFSAQKF